MRPGEVLMNSQHSELFISVDVETSGPVPGIYSMLSLGACVVVDPDICFYRELKPMTMAHDPEALAVTGFDLSVLIENGCEPRLAMKDFALWVKKQCGSESKPVFVGFNAAFDWSFINYYFHYYDVENPFGYAALDIKSYFMAMQKTSWQESRSSFAGKHFSIPRKNDHNALDDSIFQAGIFSALRDEKEK